MIEVKLMFSPDEAIQMFRNAGLEVSMHDMPVWYNSLHEPDGGHMEQIPMWTVINPKNGMCERVHEFFAKYLEMKKDQLFLNPEKLEIYNLFTQ